MIEGPRGPANQPAHVIRMMSVMALVATLGLGGCSVGVTSPPTDPSLTVFAAASLGRAMNAVADAYATATGTSLVVSVDSSTALRIQIEQGAPADVFLSADMSNPAALAAAGLVDGDVVVFAGNALAIVVPADNPAGIERPADLARLNVKIIAAGGAVPISHYAASLLDRLAVLPGAPPDLVARYAANVVSREDNVASVLAKIELGEGDAAIVYASDAARATSVIRIPIPIEAEVVADYSGVVPVSALRLAAGHAFLAWLAGPAGQSVLATFGFAPAP